MERRLAVDYIQLLKRHKENPEPVGITIPRRLAELLGWRPGDYVIVEIVEVDGEKMLRVVKIDVCEYLRMKGLA